MSAQIGSTAQLAAAQPGFIQEAYRGGLQHMQTSQHCLLHKLAKEYIVWINPQKFQESGVALGSRQVTQNTNDVQEMP